MLDGNVLGDASLETIAMGSIGRGLKSLLIGGNSGITTTGLIRLIESPAADSLALLNVDGPAVTRVFAESLAASSRSQALRRLVLDGTQLGARGVAVILDSPYLQNLQYLSVRGCGLRADGEVVMRLDAAFGGGGYGPGAGGWRTRRTS
jgi:hypothetical protein